MLGGRSRESVLFQPPQFRASPRLRPRHALHGRGGRVRGPCRGVWRVRTAGRRADFGPGPARRGCRDRGRAGPRRVSSAGAASFEASLAGVVLADAAPARPQSGGGILYLRPLVAVLPTSMLVESPAPPIEPAPAGGHSNRALLGRWTRRTEVDDATGGLDRDDRDRRESSLVRSRRSRHHHPRSRPAGTLGPFK
jgi:hypothetical protein